MTGAYYAKKTFSGLFVREENLEKWKEYLLIGLTYLIVLFALNDRFNAFNTWKKLYIQRMIFFPLCIFVMFSLTLILKKKDYPFLSKFGKITLELYLLHEWLLHISRIIVFNYINENKLLAILLIIIMFFVSVLIASAIHRFFNAVLTREKTFASH